MRKALDVLVVDDNVGKACEVARALRQRHMVRIAVGLRDAIHELAHRVPDVIVAACDMPPYRGDALLAMVAGENPSVRRILVKGPLDPSRLLAVVDGEERPSVADD